jgi:hypothetical protein
MTKSFDRKQIGLAVACALALSILSGTAGAQFVQPQDVKDRAYLDDTRNAVVKSGFGLCWHTGFGPPPTPGSQCDPNYMPAVAYVAPPTPVLKSEPVPAPKMTAVAVVQPPAVQPPAVVRAPERALAPAPLYVPPQRPAKKDRN